MSREMAELQEKLTHALASAEGPQAKYAAYQAVMKDAMANGCSRTNVNDLKNHYSIANSLALTHKGGAPMPKNSFRPGPGAGAVKPDQQHPVYTPRIKMTAL